MALRMIQMVLERPLDQAQREGLSELRPVALWEIRLSDDRILLTITAKAEQSESLMDRLREIFGESEELRINLSALEATLPPPPEEEEEAEAASSGEEGEKAAAPSSRVSREELYDDVSDASRLTVEFFVMSFVSAVVASLGMIRDNTAVVIGAMVIAPLLGPNVSLSLATTLGDFVLAARSLKVNVAGMVTALMPAVFIGLAMPIDPQTHEIALRTRVELLDLALGIASGIAAALAFTSGLSSALIGVMVAVALMPPLVAFGLMLGTGEFALAFRSGQLLAANVICINLSAVTTFLVQGIRPWSGEDEKRARRSTLLALIFWILLLSALSAVILAGR